MKNRFLLLALLAFVSVFSACDDDEPPLPDNALAFEAQALGFDAAQSSMQVKLKLSRPADVAVPVTVQLTGQGVTYGAHFTTNPAATNGLVALTIPAGSSEVSFTVAKVAGVLLDGTEKITFEVQSAAQPVVLGSANTLTLSFSEILSGGATLDINGGGPTYPNKVFIDLSANRQTAVARSAWDLGFHSGADFRVTLNATAGALAYRLDKTDLSQVGTADTVDLVSRLVLSSTAPSTETMAYVDDPDGDLTKTVIAAISANETENKVYIVNRGSSGIGARRWQKIRVVRSGDGYTLQYADITSPSFKTLSVSKDPRYNFKYVSFDNGAVEVEPAKDRWDIAWSGSVYKTNFGAGLIPYYFQDFVVQNSPGGVQVKQVMASEVSYEAFNETNLSSLTFSTGIATIGSTWRATGMSGATIHTDRFYVVKDPAGNIYKLKFTALAQNGERGRPQIVYALLKKG
ncbi:HmuY family protein [Sabulibacter ruber]|uniref:HmuY family protein n=1 Tax=Sabulibacter ruber TaxID=2811901 RepID=UPI001A958E96|nr:HmuY family protein [Sabulibacter ruber]